MRFLGLFDVIILALVVYRLARAITYDKVGEPLRKWLYKSGAKRKLGSWGFSLVSCPWCISVWISALAVAWWVALILPTWPGWGEFLVAIAAVAGASSLMISADMTAKKYLDN
jgi:hypothetical protein